ncbi:MAG: hypothetical protein IKH76_04575, partial [Clostridiales bacterium]|nr:hypothetical protein [Clostridiales bacterium]
EGMQVKATSDNGLVISGDNKSTWLTAWDVGMTSSAALAPTSVNGTALSWVSNKSHDFNDEDSEQGVDTYDTLSLTYNVPNPANGDFLAANSDGIGRDSTTGFDYVLKKTFFIKASGTEALAETLAIKSVTATITHSGTNTDDNELDKALRVMFIIDGNAYIYAPVTGYDNTIKWKNTTTLTLIAATTQTSTSVTTVPNVDANAVQAEMYIYFEGEDDACKSANIQGISLDDIEVSAAFTTVQ